MKKIKIVKNFTKEFTEISNNKIVFEKGIYHFYKEDAESFEVHFSNRKYRNRR